jgi:integrase
MKHVRLDTKTVASLTSPEDGRDDAVYWDVTLPRFGLRLRRSGGRIVRTYIAQYRQDGASLRSTIGSADVLAPDQARAAARKLLAKVELGGNPQGDRNERRAKDAVTFRSVAAEYLEAKQDALRPATFRASKQYLTGRYFKPLHAMPIDRITRRDVAARLVAIARESGKPTAGQARAKVSALFTWCMKQGLCEANCVLGTEQPKANPPRARILSDSEIASIWNAASGDSDFDTIIRLLVLLPARRQEIGGMLWNELSALDGPAPTWTLAASRSKNHHSIVYPLMPTALDIIKSVPHRGDRKQLFGSRHERGFSSWQRAKKLFNQKLTIAPWGIHDLRRSIATRVADLGIMPHVIEQLLNHQSGHRAGVHGIYNRSTYAKEIVQALGMWEEHVRSLVKAASAR